MSRNSYSPPQLPREHGAWVMLLLPLVFGLALAGPDPTGAWAIPPAAVLAYLAHAAWVPVIQRRLQGKPAAPQWLRRRILWGVIPLVAALLCFAAAVRLTPGSLRVSLVGVAAAAALGGAVYSAATSLGAGRRTWAELIGMAAMSLTAPMMALAAGREAVPGLVTASFLAFAYSVSALTFVRAYACLDRHKGAATTVCLVVHALLLVGIGGLAAAGWTPPWAPVVFLPVLARTLWGLARPPRNLRLLGLREVWVATSFAVLGFALLAVPS